MPTLFKDIPSLNKLLGFEEWMDEYSIKEMPLNLSILVKKIEDELEITLASVKQPSLLINQINKQIDDIRGGLLNNHLFSDEEYTSLIELIFKDQINLNTELDYAAFGGKELSIPLMEGDKAREHYPQSMVEGLNSYLNVTRRQKYYGGGHLYNSILKQYLSNKHPEYKLKFYLDSEILRYTVLGMYVKAALIDVEEVIEDLIEKLDSFVSLEKIPINLGKEEIAIFFKILKDADLIGDISLAAYQRTISRAFDTTKSKPSRLTLSTLNKCMKSGHLTSYPIIKNMQQAIKSITSTARDQRYI